MSDLDDVLVYHVELSYIRDEPHYLAVVGDGELHGDIPEGAVALRAVIMPAEVFESRAAEYNIDPEAEGGWEALFHMTLAPQGEGDRDVAAELEDPDHIYNAPTIAHAREAKLRRIKGALGKRKLRGVPGVSEHRLLAAEGVRIEESAAEDPLEFIKRTAPMSPEHIAVKAEFVRRTRVQFKARRLGLDPDRAYTPQELERHEKTRAMKKEPTRETAREMAIRMLGAPLEPTGDRLPPRLGQPSKFL